MCEMNEKKEQGAENISNRLLESRSILLFGDLDEKKAASVIASMLYLQQKNKEEKITLYINSSGGCETQVLAVFDVMQHLTCPVETVCVGKAHGLSALILAGGTKGMRKAYANSEVMLMQVGRERTFGQASDIELETEHLLESKARILGILAKLCGKEAKHIEADMERKYWLYAEQAKAYGLIDEMI